MLLWNGPSGAIALNFTRLHGPVVHEPNLRDGKAVARDQVDLVEAVLAPNCHTGIETTTVGPVKAYGADQVPQHNRLGVVGNPPRLIEHQRAQAAIWAQVVDVPAKAQRENMIPHVGWQWARGLDIEPRTYNENEEKNGHKSHDIKPPFL